MVKISFGDEAQEALYSALRWISRENVQRRDPHADGDGWGYTVDVTKPDGRTITAEVLRVERLEDGILEDGFCWLVLNANWEARPYRADQPMDSYQDVEIRVLVHTLLAIRIH